MATDNKKLTLEERIEKVQNMTDQEWQDYRETEWQKKAETYNDENVIPDWFWPTQTDKEYRRKTWVKKCRTYKTPDGKPAEFFWPDKEFYLDFLRKASVRQQKFAARKEKKNG